MGIGRPSAQGRRGDARSIVWPLARVLDVDEHRPAVGRLRDPSNFTTVWPRQEAPHLFGAGVDSHQLVGAHARVGTAIDRRRRHIGLDPQHAASIQVDAVRRTKVLPRLSLSNIASVLDLRVRAVTASQEDLPPEGLGGRIPAWLGRHCDVAAKQRLPAHSCLSQCTCDLELELSGKISSKLIFSQYFLSFNNNDYHSHFV